MVSKREPLHMFMIYISQLNTFVATVAGNICHHMCTVRNITEITLFDPVDQREEPTSVTALTNSIMLLPK